MTLIYRSTGWRLMTNPVDQLWPAAVSLADGHASCTAIDCLGLSGTVTISDDRSYLP